MQITSPELQTKVDVLKDMLMYREDKRQCIFTNEELETIIRYVCTEWISRVFSVFCFIIILF